MKNLCRVYECSPVFYYFFFFEVDFNLKGTDRIYPTWRAPSHGEDAGNSAGTINIDIYGWKTKDCNYLDSKKCLKLTLCFESK